MNQGTLFIVSAPSGAGKTSLLRELRKRLEGFVVSISHTTRPRRSGEVHGQDYFFIDPEQFRAMLSEEAFLEHAKVFDHYYGTAKKTVEENIDEGLDVILEIDWQGAQQVREKRPDCLSIFILPPSRPALEARLQGRGQDSRETIVRRMRDAIAEMSHYREYDYLIVNDDFERALEQLKSIIISTRVKKDRQERALADLLKSLLEDG